MTLASFLLTGFEGGMICSENWRAFLDLVKTDNPTLKITLRIHEREDRIEKMMPNFLWTWANLGNDSHLLILYFNLFYLLIQVGGIFLLLTNPSWVFEIMIKI